MAPQLNAAFPLNTYPVVTLLPDGGVAVSAGKTLAKYRRAGGAAFAKAFSWPNHPHAPRSYPQTAAQTPLPMYPPYQRCGGGRLPACKPASGRDTTGRLMRSHPDALDQPPASRAASPCGPLFCLQAALPGRRRLCPGPRQ